MKNSIFFLLTITTLFIFSCKKDNCTAGQGGAIAVAAFPQHHTKPIYSDALPGYADSAWVKFNTQDFPGTSTSDYDLILVGDSGEDHVHIMNLKCGNYYIYMTGWDTSIGQRVTGGIPYVIPENSASEIDMDVPVTE